MIVLSEKGARGVSSRCESFKGPHAAASREPGQYSVTGNHMLFIANSTTVASQTNPVSPVYKASTSHTAAVGIGKP